MPGTNLTRAEAAARAAILHVDVYDVRLDFTTGEATFATTTTVHFGCSTPGASTWIDFVGAGVARVVLNGHELDPDRVYAEGRIALPALNADNTLLVEATGRYTNSGEGVHRFVDPVDAEVYLYTQFEPALSRQMFAVFEQPDLKASFAFTVTAPAHWTVLSNEPVTATVPAGDDTATWTFAPTPRISSYITAICAGAYVGVHDSTTGRNGEIPLGLYTRASLATHLDPEFLFDLTKVGISFFEKEFDCPYPFAKLDQIFVPEFIWGGMENAGCVTITEVYIFRGQAPAAVAERRALTVLHEIAHMWFGNLVTMRWWDDLWLNESFAEWASSVCQAEATAWTDAWTTFHAHEKTWAYQQDQQADTHPVVADMRDLHDVETGTDAITYAKGGSALKQLVAFVGRDAFVEGLRSYFRRHAWGNTTAADLLVELERACGRDLGDWWQRWLGTTGPDLIRVDLQTDAAGVVTSAALLQSSPAGQPLRPHRIGVGSYRLEGDRLVRTDFTEVDADGPRTELPHLVGAPRPDLVLPNDEDLTYARIRLDGPSLALALATPEALPSLPRSLVVGSVWEQLRDGQVAPSTVADFLLRVVAVEEHSVVLRTVLQTTKQTVSMLLALVRWFLPPELRPQWRDRAVAVLRDLLATAVPGSDKQAQLLTAYAALAHLPADTHHVLGILDGSVLVPGLDLNQDLRWRLLVGLASTGAVDEARITDELRRDPSSTGHDEALQARTARPDAAAKEAGWRAAVVEGGLSNSAMEAVGKGLRRVDELSLLEPFVEPYHENIERVGAENAFAIAEKYVKFFYPLDLASVQLQATSQRWLDEHPEAHAGLRRLLVEQLAVVDFAVGAQRAEAEAQAQAQAQADGPQARVAP